MFGKDANYPDAGVFYVGDLEWRSCGNFNSEVSMNFNVYGHAAGKELRFVCAVVLLDGEGLDIVREDVHQPSLLASYAAENYGPAGACARSAGLVEALARGESAPTKRDLRLYGRHSAHGLAKSHPAVQGSNHGAKEIRCDGMERRRRARRTRMEANDHLFAGVQVAPRR